MTLLRHTPSEPIERKALTVNPAKTCQPIGALYAALGINGCLPHSHGSQGCCSYHRSQLTRHFKEPVVAATSSFTEGSSVFGGQGNMLQAITTIFETYDPEVIAIHTTCLSETIGDDLVQIVKKAETDGKIPEGKVVFHANTPSFQGSHVTGFSSMVKAMVDKFTTTEGEQTGTINLIPGYVDPADMREAKRLANVMGVETLMFPDTTGVLDCAMRPETEMFPDGGVTIAQLRTTGLGAGTIALGPSASGAAARALEARCDVKAEILEMPIGLSATDAYVNALRTMGEVEVPAELTWERGRLVDLMADAQQYFFNKTVALWGDPDQLVSLVGFCLDLGMKPRYVVTGTPGGKDFMRRMETVIDGRCDDMVIEQGLTKDMYLLHQHIKQAPVDLLIGGTHGKYIARDEDIPLVRHGFPIMDRVGHQYFTTYGYVGGMRLAEQILNAFQDRQDRDAPEAKFELVM